MEQRKEKIRKDRKGSRRGKTKEVKSNKRRTGEIKEKARKDR